MIAAFNQSTEGSVNSDPYDKVKPVSKKSFEEDTTQQTMRQASDGGQNTKEDKYQ